MPPRKLYFEHIKVGDEIPAMAKSPVDRVQLVRYAGATGDFNPLSVDEHYAKTLGMPSVLAPASLGMGFLGQLVTDWARGAQVRRFSARFVRMVWPGDTVVCKGRVSDRHGQDGRYLVDLDVWAENQKGELVVRGSVAVQLFYSSEDENRFRTGQPPLVVNVPRHSILSSPAPAVPPAKGSTAPTPHRSASASSSAKPAASKKPSPKHPPTRPAPSRATAAPRPTVPPKVRPKPKPKAKPKPKPKAKVRSARPTHRR